MTFLKHALIALVALTSYSVMAAEQPTVDDTVVLACDVNKNLYVTSSSSFGYEAGSKSCSVILTELQNMGFVFQQNTVATSSAVVYTLVYVAQ